MVTGLWITRFRPLAGFWFLNKSQAKKRAQYPDEFPSPCGVLVLKFTDSDCWVSQLSYFRPLAGFWFLNIGVTATSEDEAALISVPLRGSGS